MKGERADTKRFRCFSHAGLAVVMSLVCATKCSVSLYPCLLTVALSLGVYNFYALVQLDCGSARFNGSGATDMKAVFIHWR